MDRILQQLHVDAHQLLARLQQERASVYAKTTKTEESWKRLCQLDRWTETLLQQPQGNQTHCLTHVQQQRTDLYAELKLNCEALLFSTMIGSEPTAAQPPTP